MAIFTKNFSSAKFAEEPAIADVLSAGGSGNEPSEILDELSLNESKFYQAKVGKYMKTTLQNIQYNVFWWVMFVANTCKQPLIRFYASLCRESKTRDDAPTFHVVNLMSQIIPDIQLDFADLLETFDEWMSDAWSYVGGSPNDVASEDRECMMLTAIILIIHNAAAFHRRIATVYARPGS